MIGGLWTLFVFTSQLQPETAKAVLETKIEELEKIKRELEKEPKLELNIETDQINIADSDITLVIGKVNIENVGNTTTVLNLPERPVKIYEVTFDEAGNESWEQVRELQLLLQSDAIVASISMHASAQNSAAFSTYLDSPGLYAIRFGANRSKEEILKTLARGAQVSGDKLIVEWSTISYLFVEPRT